MTDMPERSPTQHPAPVSQSALEALAVPDTIRVEIVDRTSVAVHIGDRVEVYQATGNDGYVPRRPDPRTVVDVLQRTAAAYAQAASLLLRPHLMEPGAAELARAWMRPDRANR